MNGGKKDASDLCDLLLDAHDGAAGGDGAEERDAVLFGDDTVPQDEIHEQGALAYDALLGHFEEIQITCSPRRMQEGERTGKPLHVSCF